MIIWEFKKKSVGLNILGVGLKEELVKKVEREWS